MPKIRRERIPTSLVAFVDVLGFTEKVLRVKRDAELRALDGEIRQVQRQFEVGATDSLTRQVHDALKKEVLAFSDCIVIRAALDSDLAVREGTLDALMGEICSMALSQAACVVVHEVFLRGAIDFGFWRRSGRRLISPALARAYHLERSAIVPVIRLSDVARKFFGSHLHRHFYSQDIDPVSSSFLIYKDTKSGDAFWFLDYMNLCINNLDWIDSRARFESYKAAPRESVERGEILDAGYQANIRKWLGWHRDSVQRAYSRARDPRVRFKYQWLAAYHNRTVDKLRKDVGFPRIPSSIIPSLTPNFEIKALPVRRGGKRRMRQVLEEQLRISREI